MSKEKYRSFEVDSYSIDDKLEPQITQEMNELGLDEEQQGFVWGALMFGPRWIMSLLHGLIVSDKTDSDGGNITIIYDESVREQNKNR